MSTEPARLNRTGGETLAYRSRLASAGAAGSPGIVFLPGFHSSMDGDKATALDAYCAARGVALLRFDYFGHGLSSGDFADGTIGRWAEDAVAVLDELSEGPQILVGSSMGAWIMLLAALARPQRVAALVGIAAAPDFTEDLITQQLDAAARAALARDGVWQRPNCYDDEPYPISQRLLDEGREHLLLRAPIALSCPARLLHGLQDDDVPWQTSLRLSRRLASDDTRLTLVKNGNHRLSRPQDIALLQQQLDELLG